VPVHAPIESNPTHRLKLPERSPGIIGLTIPPNAPINANSSLGAAICDSRRGCTPLKSAGPFKTELAKGPASSAFKPKPK
jgi:hypothetical protein